MDVSVLLAVTSTRGRHILFRHPPPPPPEDPPLGARWSELGAHGLPHRVLAHLLTPSAQLCDRRFQVEVDGGAMTFVGIPSAMAAAHPAPEAVVSAVDERDKEADEPVGWAQRRLRRRSSAVDVLAPRTLTHLWKTPEMGEEAEGSSSSTSLRRAPVPSAPVSGDQRGLHASLRLAKPGHASPRVLQTSRLSTEPLLDMASPAPSASSSGISRPPSVEPWQAEATHANTSASVSSTRIAAPRPKPLDLRAALPASFKSHHRHRARARKHGHARSVSVATTPSLDRLALDGAHFDLPRASPSPTQRTPLGLSSSFRHRADMAVSAPPPASPAPHPWHLTLYHVVFVIKPRLAVRHTRVLQPHEVHSTIDTLYRRVVRPFAFALLQEQRRCRYVQRECEAILHIIDEVSMAAAPGVGLAAAEIDEIQRRVMATSMLARDMAKVCDAVQASRAVWCRINATLPLLMYPVETAGVDAQAQQRSAPIAVRTDAAPYGYLRPYHALLLYEDAEVMIRRVEVKSNARMCALLEHLSPIITLETAAMSAGLAWLEVCQLAIDLVEWGKARIIDAVTFRGKYVVEAHADMKRVAMLQTEFAESFPPFTLPGFLTALSYIPPKPRAATAATAASVPTHRLAASSTPPHPLLLDLMHQQHAGRTDTQARDAALTKGALRQRHHQGTYLEALVYLLRHGLIRQVHTHVMLMVPNRMRDPDAYVKVGQVAASGAATTALMTPDNASDANGTGMAASGVLYRAPSTSGLASLVRDGDSNASTSQGMAPMALPLHTFQDEYGLVSLESSMQDAEREWLRSLTVGQPREVAAGFWRLVGMWDGRFSVEEMAWRAGMTRREVVEVVHRFRNDVVTVTY